jgi:FHA domain
MHFPFRNKVVKRCPEGHIVNPASGRCPRCSGNTQASVARDITERTVMVKPEGEKVVAAPRAVAPTSGGPNAVVARIQVVEGPLVGREFEVRAGRVKMGKAPRTEADASAISLEDPYMSRDHAALVAGAAAVILVDLTSTNGTFLNGERVQRAILKDGDHVRMGRTTLRVVLATGA